MAGLKLVHLVQITPHRCGLYETVRDLVAAECALGADARMLDPRALRDDRGAPVVGTEWLAEVDVIVSHSGPGKLDTLHKPIIHVMHGRPESSFRLELDGSTKVYSYLHQHRNDPRFKAFVTFWPEYAPYWSHVLGREVTVLPPPVDLTAWKSTPVAYDFGKKAGAVNIIITDVWRVDKDPFHVVHAFMEFHKSNPGARLHLYGLPKDAGVKWKHLLGLLLERLALGELRAWVKNLDIVYRAADALITPHRIATRTVREALACGCQVVMGPGNHYTPYTAEPEDIISFAATLNRAVSDHQTNRAATRAANRSAAEIHFDSKETAKQMIELAGRIAHGSG